MGLHAKAEELKNIAIKPGVAVRWTLQKGLASAARRSKLKNTVFRFLGLPDEGDATSKAPQRRAPGTSDPCTYIRMYIYIYIHIRYDID